MACAGRSTDHGFRWAEAALPDDFQTETIEGLLVQFESVGFTNDAETPSVAVAAAAARVGVPDAQEIVDAMVRQGRLVRVGEDLYYPAERLNEVLGRLVAAMEKAGQLTLAEARDMLGTSRRYAQSLLEHMDSEGLTLRVGDARRLRRRRG
jgi:hypothetical protein